MNSNLIAKHGGRGPIDVLQEEQHSCYQRLYGNYKHQGRSGRQKETEIQRRCEKFHSSVNKLILNYGTN